MLLSRRHQGNNIDQVAPCYHRELLDLGQQLNLRLGVHPSAQVPMQVSPQIIFTTSKELIPDVGDSRQLTGSLVGLEQALEEYEVILTTSHLNCRAANFFCSSLLTAGLHRWNWLLLMIVLVVQHQQLHGEASLHLR